MKHASCILLACILLASAGCGSSDQSDQAAATKAPPSGTINISKSNVFSPLVNDLNKAKQVNNQVQQQFQQTNGQVEAASSSNAPAAASGGP